MAGAILISEVNGVSMSGVAFCHITDAVRIFLQDAGVLEEIYQPLDEGGMDFISLVNLDRDGFKAFCDAARNAFIREQTENSDVPFRSEWEELLGALCADPRVNR